MSRKAQTSKINGLKGGRPKGSRNPETLEREAVLKEFRYKTMKAADVLFNSQLHLAKGQTFLYKIEKEVRQIGKNKTIIPKKPKLVTDQAEIEMYLNGEINGDNDMNDPEDTYYFITAKEPDNRAIDSLLDRSLGKVTQAVSLEDQDGNSVPIVAINVIPMQDDNK